MAEGFSSPINLGLPQTPSGVPDEMYEQFLKIYNAIAILHQEVIKYTGGGVLDLSNYLSSVNPAFAESVQAHKLVPILVTASVAIAAGEQVNLFNSAGVLKARLAQANALATKSWGWAPAAIGNGAVGVVFLGIGLNQAVSGLAVGSVYYLSSATPGGITATRPVAAGTISQEVGIALSATELYTRLLPFQPVN